MYCRQCGTQNADGAGRCSSCGNTLDQRPTFSAPNPATAPANAAGGFDAQNPYAATADTGGFGPTGDKPKNYLVESILATLCCCLPLGIAGIVFAAQVDSKWNAGDYHGAVEAAANAKKFTLIAFGIGLVVNGLIWGINILGIIAGAAGAGGGPNGF